MRSLLSGDTVVPKHIRKYSRRLARALLIVASLIEFEKDVLKLKPRVLAAKCIARACREKNISIRKVLRENGVSYFYVMRVYKK